MILVGKALVFDIETTGLSPLDSQVTCVCWKLAGSDGAPRCVVGEFESRVISDFVSEVKRLGVDTLVTFNGWLFDVPFLRVRAMKHGVELPGVFWRDGCLVDPYHILRRCKRGKQCEFARLFGHEICGTGKECLDWFAKGELSKIEEHCASDIVALDLIYSRMLDAGFVK